MAGGGSSAPLDTSCRQKQYYWSRDRCLVRTAERTSSMGVARSTPSRDPASGLPKLRMGPLWPNKYGMVYGYLSTNWYRRLCYTALAQPQHFSAISELLLRILCDPAPNHLFWVHHCRHDSSAIYRSVLPRLHIHPDRTVYCGPPHPDITLCIQQHPSWPGYLDIL